MSPRTVSRGMGSWPGSAAPSWPSKPAANGAPAVADTAPKNIRRSTVTLHFRALAGRPLAA
jgi:hypothetical protein